MLMYKLSARLIEHVPSPEGVQANLTLIEPNGDEHRVRCLCKSDRTTHLYGDGEMIKFLHDKFGAETVCALARQVTLKDVR